MRRQLDITGIVLYWALHQKNHYYANSQDAYIAGAIQVIATLSALKRHGMTEGSCKISIHRVRPLTSLALR